MVWVALLVVAAVLSALSSLLASRANAGTRLPAWGRLPKSSARQRLTWLGTAICGLVAASYGHHQFGDGIWLWAVAAMAVPGLAVWWLHNRRIRS